MSLSWEDRAWIAHDFFRAERRRKKDLEEEKD